MAEMNDYQQLTARIGGNPNGILPDIFKSLADENEAKILLAASPPATIQELAQKTGLNESDVEKMIDDLFRKGLIFKSKKPDAVRHYAVRHVMQFHDATGVAKNAKREMLDLWKKYMAEEWSGYMQVMEKAVGKPIARIVAVNESLDHKTQILAFDDVMKILDDATSLAVTNCSCRVIDGSCGKPVEVCLQVNKAADYAVERGTGRTISKEEGLEILKKCGEEGLVHCADNRRSVGMVICNCCKDCCMNWPGGRVGLGTFVAPSRFKAQVEPGDCTACEDCIEMCVFDAIAMDDTGDAAVVNDEYCMGCGVCKTGCPAEAINLEAVRPPEFVPE